MTKKTIRKTTRTADGGQIYSADGFRGASRAETAYKERALGGNKTISPKITEELSKASAYATVPGSKKMADSFGASGKKYAIGVNKLNISATSRKNPVKPKGK